VVGSLSSVVELRLATGDKPEYLAGGYHDLDFNAN